MNNHIRSIQFKLLLPFVTGALAFALALPVYTYWAERKTLRDAIDMVARAKTESAVSMMAFLFRLQLLRVQNIALETRVAQLFNEKRPDAESVANVAEFLKTLIDSGDYYRDICIVNRDAECISSNNPSLIGRSFSRSATIRAALAGEVKIGEFSLNKITEKLSVTVAGPVDIGSQTVGAVMIINEFPKLVHNRNEEIVAVSILAGNGKFVTHQNYEMLTASEGTFNDLYAELSPAGAEGRPVAYELQNRRYVGFARVEPTSRWLIIASGAEEQLFAGVYRVCIVIFLASLGIFGIIIAVVTHFMRGITGTLLNLIRYAKRVATGTINVKSLSNASLSRNDELGVLATSLNQMVKSMHLMINKAREASKMKSDFLANMSHEIRTPINAVIGMASLALRDQEMTPKNRDYLEKIQMAARSLLGVLNDILDISKIEAGKLELEKRPFRLAQLIDNVTSIHQISASNKGIELRTEIDSEMPIAVIGDQLRLGQVLNNLISNAIKFTAKGKVRLHCNVIDETTAGALLEFTIADQGVGISKDAITKLFRPFSQADTSISRKFGGTGLGLAISLNLVGMMPEGKISVISKIGEGTTFVVKVRLPVEYDLEFNTAEIQPTEDDFTKLNLRHKTVLIAEDNLINQEILSELIAPSGVKIVIANNGKEALDLAAKQDFDLVFMDMQMPIMDGLQATREMRKNPKLRRLPIVAVSANAMKEHRETGIAAGMNDYITKPVEVIELYEMLKKWLTDK